MLTRRFLGTAVAALAFVAASGSARAAERQLMGIVLGRSYHQVLNKFGSPDRVQVVVIPVPGQGTAGMADQNAPGGVPGYGGPGGGPGVPGYGAPSASPYGGPAGGSSGPGGSGGPPGMGSSGPGGSGGPPGAMPGGPPVLPPVGGGPGAPGGDFPSGAQLQGVGNGAEWIYNRPGGTTLAFIINEDGRVAQISVSSSKSLPAARTARGVTLGMDYKRVLSTYGWPQTQLIGGYYVETYYTKNHHASFTFVKGKLVRITIALAD